MTWRDGRACPRTMCRPALLAAMFLCGLMYAATTVIRAEDAPPVDEPREEVIDPRHVPSDAPEGAAVQNPAEFAKVKESFGKWQALNEKNGGSYQYTVKFQSWTGFGSTTTIVVFKGKVVERSYAETNTREPLEAEIVVGPDGEKRETVKKPPGKSWTEKAAEIGTHNAGAAAKTIDELYAQAAEILRRKTPQHNHITVRFHADGLLHLCMFADKNCADDCSQGVQIENIIFVQ